MSPLPRVLLLLVAAIATACGSTPSATGTPGPTGIVRMSVQQGPGARVFFGSEHRARITAADGTVVLDVQLADDAATTAAVPAGAARVSMFTVFFADVLVCPSLVPGAAVPTCFRPTLGPSQVCEMPIDVRTDSALDLRFTILADGRCGLESVAAPASPSPGPT